MSGVQGWYLYGITESGRPADLLERVEGVPGGDPLRLITCDEVAAIVQPVPLSEFGPEALAARLDDAAWVEAAARRHHDVVTTLHGRCSLLPARFGALYASPDDVLGALQQHHVALRDQLRHVAGCDEWALWLYADRSALLPAVESRHPALAVLQQDVASASPGRAYLLGRKLATERDHALEENLIALAEEAYTRLMQHAVDGRRAVLAQAAHASPEADGVGGEQPLLHADLLVPRARLDAFAAALDAFATMHTGVRWAWSGPWPPYSFATPLTEPAEGQAS